MNNEEAIKIKATGTRQQGTGKKDQARARNIQKIGSFLNNEEAVKHDPRDKYPSANKNVANTTQIL